jgi:gamma-glutamyl phosphate reductase
MNPFARYIAGKMPKTILARSYAKHFFDLIDASTKFHFKERVHADDHYANIADVFAVDKIYGNAFMKSLYRISSVGEEILNISDTPKSLKDVHTALTEQMPGVSLKLTAQTLHDLVDSGFMIEDAKHYKKKEDSPSLTFNIDYQECLADGIAFMNEYVPQHVDAWNEQQTSIYDPLTRETRNIHD